MTKQPEDEKSIIRTEINRLERESKNAASHAADILKIFCVSPATLHLDNAHREMLRALKLMHEAEAMSWALGFVGGQ